MAKYRYSEGISGHSVEKPLINQDDKR